MGRERERDGLMGLVGLVGWKEGSLGQVMRSDAT